MPVKGERYRCGIQKIISIESYVVFSDCKRVLRSALFRVKDSRPEREFKFSAPVRIILRLNLCKVDNLAVLRGYRFNRISVRKLSVCRVESYFLNLFLLVVTRLECKFGFNGSADILFVSDNLFFGIHTPIFKFKF